MWRKVDEPKAHSDPEVSTGSKISTDSGPSASAGLPLSSRPVACISQGIRIKGEITGREDLFVDGEIEGRIQVTEGTVTVGPNGRVQGQTEAREVAVRGLVNGNIAGTDRVHIWHTGKIKGDIRAKRIAIEDGAVVLGKLETLRSKQDAPAVKEQPKAAAGNATEPVPVSGFAS